jgi:outer membrane protein assembly factor BamE (lipoprotein component of BamABCDE complex)
MRAIVRTIAVLAMGLALAHDAPAQAEVKSSRDLAALVFGMSTKDVMNSLGEPSSIEGFEAASGAKVVVWFYYQSELEGRATMPVPLIFENGKLVAWGRSIYQKKLDTYLPSKRGK